MAADHAEITPELRAFIAAQRMFFVATAPLSASGHVNVSPKGLDTFRVLSPTRIAYLDLMGSGNETAAHALENGRITFMFCAFADPPKILRLYGRARAVQAGDAEWAELAGLFPQFPGVRQVMVAEIGRVHTSCGFGVPRMEVVAERRMLPEWAEKKTAEELAAYRRRKNAVSVDGLPAPTGGDQGPPGAI